MKWPVRSINSNMRYGWRLAGVLTASLVLMALALAFAEFDMAAPLCAAMALITGVLLIIFAVANTGRRRWVTLSALAVYLLISAFLFPHLWVSRSHVRWLLLSHSYEAKVLAKPAPGSGEFKHVAWDGWGMAGQETDAYLVFDPSNSLAATLGARAPVRAAGLPCRVHQITRLASQWYAVQFYTDVTWVHGECV